MLTKKLENGGFEISKSLIVPILQDDFLQESPQAFNRGGCFANEYFLMLNRLRRSGIFDPRQG
jgi:hypothetical protein